MDDNAPKENPSSGFNKLDLSQLQGFSFGTQWTQDKSSPAESRERSDRPRRDDRERRDGPGGGAAPDRRDRRAFRKPAVTNDPSAAPDRAAAPGGSDRREYSGERGPRREGAGEYRGGPRREGGDQRGARYGRTEAPFDRGPYDSPYFTGTFYPEDTSFNTLVQTIRKSCRTIELFEIARTVVAKLDRFIVVLARKTPLAAEGGPATEVVKQPIYLSVPDGLPFDTEEAAVAHVLTKHLGIFFDTADVEVEAPKGNFQVINRCSVTGELLGPPNYHRYNHIVQQHHATKISRMSLDAYRSRIETVRDPEVVAQWLEKMKKATRYSWKNPANVRLGTTTAPFVAREPAPVETAPAVEGATADAAEGAGPATATVPALTFDSFEDARTFLLTQARDKVVRTVETARFHGKMCEQLPPGEIRRAIEGALERQRRFPLDTANALRGRLRREHFTIFKKGSKGISYVCAVKRKFRVPGQTFSDGIGGLINFIETHPMVRASELPAKFLGIKLPPPPKTPDPTLTTPPIPAEAAAKEGTPIEHVLTIDERAKIARMQGDLVWLVREGYVTEFIDGRLFAPPPMVEARKKEVEAEEHDPENFPEIPNTIAPFDHRTGHTGYTMPPIPLSTTPLDGSVSPAPTPAPAEEAAPVAPEPPAT